MQLFKSLKEHSSNFFGRDRELRWLEERIYRGNIFFSPVFIVGNAGVGKTSLLRRAVNFRGVLSTTIWLDLSADRNSEEEIDRFIQEIYNDKSNSNVTIAIDNAEILSDKKLEFVSSRLFNLKRVSSVIFASRRYPNFDRCEVLTLDGLLPADAERLLRSLLGSELDPATFSEAANLAQGHPLALSLLEGVFKQSDANGFSDFLKGRLYNVSKAIAVPPAKIIAVTGPTLLSANDALLEHLKRQPQSIYELSSRKFEELIAELLTDMGWDVELTQATRDGGKDILAYLNTDLGRLLCLVEAKKYRSDRKIGVELVRTLYGTLCDQQANSAMLVTTSSFSSDAHTFQKRHNYQLALRDYGDIVQWIQRYKNITINRG